MKTRKPFFFLARPSCLLALSFSFLTAAPSSSAFTLISSQVKGGWAKKELSFNVNEASCTALGISASSLNTAVQAAIDVWNKATMSSLKLKRGDTSTQQTQTDPPTIYCGTTPSDTTAGTGSISSFVHGRPAQGGIVLNGDSTKSAYFNNLNAAQQAIVVAHEMGHVLGLGHSGKQYALMYFDIGSKTELNLSQDDMDGIAWLNPRAEPSDGAMGCGTIRDIGGPHDFFGNGTALFSFLFLIALAFTVTRPRPLRSKASN